MGFAVPWALAGLVALPLLLLLYLLRRRGREVPVAALFLWREAAQPAAGRRLARQRLPLVFWLELAALALLAGAAAGPWTAGAATRPLFVVLDPSYSLQAGGDQSPRRLAEAALLAELAGDPRLRPTLVLATDPPQLLGEDLGREQVGPALARWRVDAPAAHLDAALRLAAERRAREVLVLTDAPPPGALPPRVAWWAFGAPRPNLAIVGAGRAVRPVVEEGRAGEPVTGSGPGAAAGSPASPEEVFLEVVNFGEAAAPARLSVTQGGAAAVVERELPPGETWRLRLPAASRLAWSAELAGDALPLDDRLTLPALDVAPLAVALEGLPPRLDRAVRSALVASGLASFGGEEPALEVRLAPAAPDPPPGRWRVLVAREEPAEALVGPFAVDPRHPLGTGLAVEGVVWSAGPAAANPPGDPVVTAGPVVLLADAERPDGGHDLHLRLREDLSTLERTPAWPVLWWNLLRWRRATSPGPEQPVVRLGEAAAVRLPAEVREARVVGEGWEAAIPANAGVVRFAPPRAGSYEVAAGEARWQVAVGTLQREESDLRRRGAGRWGELAGPATPDRRPVAWLLALAALALLVAQAVVLARGGRR